MAFPSSNFKPSALMRGLADRLSLRSSLAQVQSADTNGNPVLTKGSSTWSAGNQYAVIRILGVSSIQVDALGLSQTVYSPEICQLFVEGNTTAAGALPVSSDVGSVLNFANELLLMGELLRLGCRVEVWNSGHGVQPAAGAGTLVASFDDLINPLTSSM